MTVVLVTGGAGYIGSHVCKALKEGGFVPVAFDDLSHGHQWAVKWGPFFYGDLKKPEDLDQAFATFQPKAVIHLAGLINLRESIVNPYEHYSNNVLGSLSLARAMNHHKVTSLIFSSSAAVYAPHKPVPIKEESPKGPQSPYGKTKWMTEQLFEDFEKAHGLNTVSLRYFNAAGADPSGEIGEAHYPETHLIPRLIQTTLQMEEFFTLYNNTLPTPDGTAIRDFIHVTDLATAHVQALKWLLANQRSDAFNLGTGKGHSVLEVINETERITGLPIKIRIEKQKLPEPIALVADPTKAMQKLQWHAEHSSLPSVIETAVAWQRKLLAGAL